MTHPPFFARVGTALIVVASTCAKVRGQEWGLPDDAVATTWCSNGRVRTAVDVAVLGGPTEREVMMHEAIHRRQLDSLNVTLHTASQDCAPQQSREVVLRWEVDAYCAILPLYAARHQTSVAPVWRKWLGFLMSQFSEVKPEVVMQAWQTCTGPALDSLYLRKP